MQCASITVRIIIQTFILGINYTHVAILISNPLGTDVPVAPTGQRGSDHDAIPNVLRYRQYIISLNNTCLISLKKDKILNVKCFNVDISKPYTLSRLMTLQIRRGPSRCPTTVTCLGQGLSPHFSVARNYLGTSLVGLKRIK